MARKPIWNSIVAKVLRKWHSLGALDVKQIALRTPATEQDMYDWLANRKNIPLGLVKHLAELDLDPGVLHELCGFGDRYTLARRAVGESLGRRVESAYFAAAASLGNTAKEVLKAIDDGVVDRTELERIKATALEDQAAIADLVAVCDGELASYDA